VGFRCSRHQVHHTFLTIRIRAKAQYLLKKYEITNNVHILRTYDFLNIFIQFWKSLRSFCRSRCWMLLYVYAVSSYNFSVVENNMPCGFTAVYSTVFCSRTPSHNSTFIVCVLYVFSLSHHHRRLTFVRDRTKGSEDFNIHNKNNNNNDMHSEIAFICILRFCIDFLQG
jgi:hypothetical protein